MKHYEQSSHHLLRRIIHLSAMIVPVIYYWYGMVIAQYTPFSLNQLLLIFLILGLSIESIRLKRGRLIISQRDYELHQPSAMVWTIIGLIMVLYFAPYYGAHNAALGLPIIWSMCIGDPLIGELRRHQFSLISGMIITWSVIFSIWCLSYYWLGTPLWLSFVLPPLIIVAELLPLKWVDDNFTMLLVPLLVCYLWVF